MMRHNKYDSGKTIRFKVENPKHANAVPYQRSKQKIDFRNYEE